MKLDGAPRPDGFNMRFYRNFWDVVGRLKGFLYDVIAPNQSAFLKGRLISDNIMLATELMHKIKSTRKAKKGLCALKLGIQKMETQFLLIFISFVQIFYPVRLGRRKQQNYGKRPSREYASLEGQRMNTNKSFLVFSSNIPRRRLPMDSISSSIQLLAGRLTLIKFVINSYLIYPLSCMYFPKDKCRKIESLMSHFFWGHNGNNPKAHLQNWNSLCNPKHEGGLAMCNVHAFNEAMLTKQIRRLVNNNGNLADSILAAKYMDNMGMVKISSTASWRSKAIMKSKDLIVSNLEWQIGDDKDIKINHHAWWPMLRDHTQFHSVADLIKHNSMSWDVNALSSIYDSNTVRSISSLPFSVTGVKDNLVWKCSSDGQYSVRNGYNWIIRSNNSDVSGGRITMTTPNNVNVW
ncbi:reverse transcriptase [Senna tora]|uniref:Reverse transcriptase n=1 Tax=Senna tora TaxID=362788 RepID=A0A834SUI0_9FABA|nr:reverse transcriptase [Senna tora]